jgi:hypothetical protein
LQIGRPGSQNECPRGPRPTQCAERRPARGSLAKLEALNVFPSCAVQTSGGGTAGAAVASSFRQCSGPSIPCVHFTLSPLHSRYKDPEDSPLQPLPRIRTRLKASFINHPLPLPYFLFLFRPQSVTLKANLPLNLPETTKTISYPTHQNNNRHNARP